jgi:hypothetical protein
MYVFEVNDQDVAQSLLSVLNLLSNVDAKIYEKGRRCKVNNSHRKETRNNVNDIRGIVVDRLKNGDPCEEIAEDLGISVHSIRGYKAMVTMGKY